MLSNKTFKEKLSALFGGTHTTAQDKTARADKEALVKRYSVPARFMSVVLAVTLVTSMCPGVGLATNDSEEAPAVPESTQPADQGTDSSTAAPAPEQAAGDVDGLTDDSPADDATTLEAADPAEDLEAQVMTADVELFGEASVATAEELYAAIAAVDVTSITLTTNITIDQPLTVDRELTVQGATLSRSDRTKSVFVVTSTGALTLQNISLADGGSNGNTSNYTSAIVTSGTLNLNSGAVISGFKAADGGAVTAESGSNVNINGATLSNNMACGTSHAAMGGAVYAKSGSTIEMTSGTIDGNVACSANNPDNRNGGIGGGFYIATGAFMTMENGTISNNQAGYYSSDQWTAGRNGAGGGVFVNTKAGFVMNNGVVSDNTAWAGTSGVNYYGGGGICIWNSGGYDFSGSAQINAGSITGNTSVGVGGGVYVHNYRLLPMHSAAVVTNAATINGGGLYLCMVGEVYNYATDCTIFTNNAAAASDYAAQGDDIWSDEPWYGSKANFHLPERTESGLPIAWYEDTRANPYTDASEPIDDFPNWFESNKNNNVGLHCDAPYDAANYAVLISGNTAKQGGGIGCNGILEMCNPDADDISLTVKKVWADDENSTEGNTEEGSDDQGPVPVADLGDDQDGNDGQDGNDDQGENPENPAGNNAIEHPEVTVNIFNGQKKIDSVVLNEENNWTATLTGLPADGNYSVVEEEVEGYESTVTVEQTSDTSWEFTITNTPEVKPVDFNVDFDKYLYALDTNQTFSFTMAECDQNGTVGQVTEVVPDEDNVIFADEPFTVTVQNGEFNDDGEASIDFPTLRFTETGTHYYRVSENEVTDNDSMVMDESWFLLKVVVGEDNDGNLDAQLESSVLNYDGEAYEVGSDEFYFCNNEMMTLSCMAMEYAVFPDEDQTVEINPLVKKELENRVLNEGEFTFKISETTPGVQRGFEAEASNDATGLVTFDLLSYNNTGTYTYDITEVAGTDESVIYDTSKITLTVDVVLDENGALRATASYESNGQEVEGATFVNKTRKPVLRVQKTSRDGSQDPLQGATYGLWMVSTGGADVYLGAAVSDESGWITFNDVNLETGETYYFKEEAAPAGHTVDEYRSDLFTVLHDENGYYLVSATADEAPDANGKQKIELMVVANEPEGTRGTVDGDVIVLSVQQNVTDEVTKLDVDKFAKGTHDRIVGAEMQIIEAETGDVVTEWTTGEGTQNIDRILNVDTEYILHEKSAPQGYDVAADTTFKINEYGDITVTSGDDAEVTGKYSLAIYDKALAVQKIENVEDVERPNNYLYTNGPKTGDFIPVVAVGALIAVALIAAVAAIAARRRKSDSK